MNKSVIISKVSEDNLFTEYFKLLDKNNVKIYIYNEIDDKSFNDLNCDKYSSTVHSYFFHIAKNYNNLSMLNYFLSSTFFNIVERPDSFISAINVTDFETPKSNFNFSKDIKRKYTEHIIFTKDEISFLNDSLDLKVSENDKTSVECENFQLSAKVIQKKPQQFYQKIVDLYSYPEYVKTLDKGLKLFFRSI